MTAAHMTDTAPSRWQVGSVLPPLALNPVTRTTLALFAGGSGDHNPIHLDIDVARTAGFPDVFAQGMLSMAYVARFVRQHVEHNELVSLSARFTAITPVGARPTCTGRVVAAEKTDDGLRAQVELAVVLDDGTVTVTGNATVLLKGEPK
jgi:acyl dehydratase